MIKRRIVGGAAIAFICINLALFMADGLFVRGYLPLELISCCTAGAALLFEEEAGIFIGLFILVAIPAPCIFAAVRTIQNKTSWMVFLGAIYALDFVIVGIPGAVATAVLDVVMLVLTGLCVIEAVKTRREDISKERTPWYGEG